MSTTLLSLENIVFPLVRGDYVEVTGSGRVVVNFAGAQRKVRIRAQSQNVGPFNAPGDCNITADQGGTVTFTLHRESDTRAGFPVTFDPSTGRLIAAGNEINIGGDGAGDVVGPSSSVDGELALFNAGSGKVLKRANTLNGIVKLVAGVVEEAEEGVDYAAPTDSVNGYFPGGW